MHHGSIALRRCYFLLRVFMCVGRGAGYVALMMGQQARNRWRHSIAPLLSMCLDGAAASVCNSHNKEVPAVRFYMLYCDMQAWPFPACTHQLHVGPLLEHICLGPSITLTRTVPGTWATTELFKVLVHSMHISPCLLLLWLRHLLLWA